MARVRRPAWRPRLEAVEDRVLTTIFGVDKRTPVANTADYPYSAVGRTASASATVVRHELDTAGGQSGSPLWQDQRGALVVLAVHIRGFDADGPAESRYNTAVRLTPRTIADVETWAAIGTPGGPRLTPIRGKPGMSALKGYVATAETHALAAA